MYKKSFLRPTAVGELRSGDMVAIEGRQLTAWGIEMLPSAYLWALSHFEVIKVMNCYLGDEHTVQLRLRTRSSAVAGERQRGWYELELNKLDPTAEIEMIKAVPRLRRRSPTPSASASALTTV